MGGELFGSYDLDVLLGRKLIGFRGSKAAILGPPLSPPSSRPRRVPYFTCPLLFPPAPAAAVKRVIVMPIALQPFSS